MTTTTTTNDDKFSRKMKEKRQLKSRGAIKHNILHQGK
jgi:hypothetical protein